MYWIAEKNNGEQIVLTEREALVHFEQNNISQRMRLRFIGTTSGNATAEAKEKIKNLINENRPEDYAQYEREEQNKIDHNIRQEHAKEIKKIKDEAYEKDLEEAKENGVKQPRKSLHVHTYSQDGHSRDEILDSAKGMV